MEDRNFTAELLDMPPRASKISICALSKREEIIDERRTIFSTKKIARIVIFS
jgi:hypothetical protein